MTSEDWRRPASQSGKTSRMVVTCVLCTLSAGMTALALQNPEQKPEPGVTENLSGEASPAAGTPDSSYVREHYKDLSDMLLWARTARPQVEPPNGTAPPVPAWLQEYRRELEQHAADIRATYNAALRADPSLFQRAEALAKRLGLPAADERDISFIHQFAGEEADRRRAEHPVPPHLAAKYRDYSGVDYNKLKSEPRK